MTLRVRSLTLAVFLFAAPCLATSIINIGPLAKADDVAIEPLLIGNTLAPEDVRAQPLLGGDSGRVTRLRESLTTAITERLSKAQIAVNPRSSYTIRFGIFGGRFPSVAPSKIVVMLEVRVWQPDTTTACAERTVINVVDDGDLETSILSMATRVLDEFIQQRAAYRAAKP